MREETELQAAMDLVEEAEIAADETDYNMGERARERFIDRYIAAAEAKGNK
jgi:hypothetical protein